MFDFILLCFFIFLFSVFFICVYIYCIVFLLCNTMLHKSQVIFFGMFFIEYTYTCFIANFYTHTYIRREKERKRESETYRRFFRNKTTKNCICCISCDMFNILFMIHSRFSKNIVYRKNYMFDIRIKYLHI